MENTTKIYGNLIIDLSTVLAVLPFRSYFDGYYTAQILLGNNTQTTISLSFYEKFLSDFAEYKGLKYEGRDQLKQKIQNKEQLTTWEMSFACIYIKSQYLNPNQTTVTFIEKPSYSEIERELNYTLEDYKKDKGILFCLRFFYCIKKKYENILFCKIEAIRMEKTVKTTYKQNGDVWECQD